MNLQIAICNLHVPSANCICDFHSNFALALCISNLHFQFSFAICIGKSSSFDLLYKVRRRGKLMIKAIVTAAVGDFTGLANQHRAQRAAS